MSVDSATTVAKKLNARTRQRNAKLAALRETPFGRDLHVRSYRLGNGLDVHVLVDREAPVVSYQTWFRVGSRHEKKGKTGLAHLFEHLMFKETKTHGPGELDRTIEAAGGETNAATWTDWTFYYENVPRSELALVMKFDADRMQNLVLRDDVVAAEKEVVMNERRMRVDDDVEGTANETLYKSAFTKHPYHWPTIGWMRDIEGFTVEDCLAFYRTYYAPNNASIVIAGDVHEMDALRLVQERYGAMKPAKIPREARVREPAQKRERRLSLELPTDTEKLDIGYRAPAYGDADYAVLTVLNEILTGGRSSRLYRVLVSEGEIASSVSASTAPFEDPGLFEVWVDGRHGKTAKVLLQAVDAELARMRRTRVSEEELEKAKNRLELGFLSALETASGKGEQVGFAATVLDDVGAVFRMVEAQRRVTADDVLAVATRYLDPARRTVIAVAPQRPKRTRAAAKGNGKGKRS
jgi:zinc protease